MVFTCDSCHYSFEAGDKPDLCPDCGKPLVRLATNAEESEYHKIRIEFGYELVPASGE